jgi:hypothetical protein
MEGIIMNKSAPLSRNTPLMFWIVSVVSLLWNGFGGYDYVMTRQKNVEYLGQMGNAQEILAWIDSLPMWVQILWPIGVWASVLGSVLLLLRSRHAVTAFLVSLVGAIASFVGQITVSVPASMDSTMNKVLPILIVVIIAVLWWYARRQVAAGVLR